MKKLTIPGRRSIFDHEVAPDYIAEIVETVQERLALGRGRINERRKDQIANPRNVRTLRVSGERRKNEAERQNNHETDPPHEWSCPGSVDGELLARLLTAAPLRGISR